MRILRALQAVGGSIVAISCAAVPEPSTEVGDVGDTSEHELKSGCSLSRDTILASVQGARRAAIERGFEWYDAQVPYSQTKNYNGYRTDCSGFVSMCWQLGTSYTTANFVQDTANWTSLSSFDELVPADALVYRKNGAGHIVMFLGWNNSAKSEACVIEQANTADDMQFRSRPTSSLHATGYHAIRATKLGSSGGGGDPTAGQCYCDSECSYHGDCCSNCSSGSGGSSGGGGAGSGGAGAGGSGGSGAGGGQCYCDAECSYHGDCCSNCGSGGSGAGGSGSGGSGAGGGQCYCDAECSYHGDCCSNCGSGSGGSGAGGSGSGGSGGGQCHCDAMCWYYGDCCSNC